MCYLQVKTEQMVLYIHDAYKQALREYEAVAEMMIIGSKVSTQYTLVTNDQLHTSGSYMPCFKLFKELRMQEIMMVIHKLVFLT